MHFPNPERLVDAGLSQRQAAKALGVDEGTVRNDVRESSAKSAEKFRTPSPVMRSDAPAGSAMAAFKALGRSEIPVTVVDLSEIVRGEFAENAIRKDFAPSEIEDIRRAMEPVVKAAAKERQAAAGPRSGRGAKPNAPGKFPEAVSQRSRDKVSAFAGVSGRTVEKIAKVVEAAERDEKEAAQGEGLGSLTRLPE